LRGWTTATKKDFTYAAQDNGAPDVLVERIGTFDRAKFFNSEDIVEGLHVSP
jgi:hypothetical protein